MNPSTFPLPGPTYVECACGCGLIGVERKRRMKDGFYHVKRCSCVRCKASRHRKNASARESRIAKDIGGTRQLMSGAISGVDVASVLVDIEETSNHSITRGFQRWWGSKAVTTKLSRLMARRIRPRCLVLTWEGRRRVAVLPYDDFRELCGERRANGGYAVEPYLAEIEEAVGKIRAMRGAWR